MKSGNRLSTFALLRLQRSMNCMVRVQTSGVRGEVHSSAAALGFVVLPFHQVLIDLAGEAAGEADQACGVLCEECCADAGFAVEAVQGGLAGETYEVAIAGLIFGENEEMVVLVVVERSAVVVVFADVEFAAEDGLESLFLHGVEEVNGSEEYAVVSHGEVRPGD